MYNSVSLQLNRYSYEYKKQDKIVDRGHLSDLLYYYQGDVINREK